MKCEHRTPISGVKVDDDSNRHHHHADEDEDDELRGIGIELPGPKRPPTTGRDSAAIRLVLPDPATSRTRSAPGNPKRISDRRLGGDISLEMREEQTRYGGHSGDEEAHQDEPAEPLNDSHATKLCDLSGLLPSVVGFGP